MPNNIKPVPNKRDGVINPWKLKFEKKTQSNFFFMGGVFLSY